MTTDKIFLLGLKQLESLYKNFDKNGKKYVFDSTNNYWLREPSTGPNDGSRIVRTVMNDSYEDSKKVGGFGASLSNHGVRPAFYLNTDIATVASGEGTAESPYTLTASTTPTLGISNISLKDGTLNYTAYISNADFESGSLVIAFFKNDAYVGRRFVDFTVQEFTNSASFELSKTDSVDFEADSYQAMVIDKTTLKPLLTSVSGSLN